MKVFMNGGNNMKYCIYVVICIFSSLSYANDNISLFETKNFLIKLQTNCEEGNVSCDDISYTGIRKSDGATIHLKGKTLNRSCEKSTCDVYGYEFKNGSYIYKIYGRAPESLTVQKDNKVILYEEGKFSADIEKFDNFAVPKESSQTDNSKLARGNSLIGQKNIITLLNDSCDFPTYESTQEEMDKCIVSEIERVYYKVLENLKKGDKIDLGQKQGFQIYLQKELNNKNEPTLTLSVIKDKHINNMLIYSQNSWESGANMLYYYIDDNLENIWLLKVIEDEMSRRVDYWKKYHIDDKGYFNLDENISCKYELFYPERKKTIVTCIKD